MFLRNYLILILTILIFGKITGQNFENKSLKELKKLYKNSSEDSTKTLYASLYLKKAKNNNDTLNVARGYRLHLLNHYPDSLSLKYADSIINLTKGINNKYFPGLGYNFKGAILYEWGKYKKALDNYLIAINLAKKNKNTSLFFDLKMNIGLLRNTMGERDKAQKVFKEYLFYLDKENKKNTESYSRGLYALADSYTYSKKIDSSEIYVKRGIKNSLSLENNTHYSYFIFNSGINNYFKKNYQQSIDSLNKANSFFIKNFNERSRSSLCYYYLGLCFRELNKTKTSIKNFNKVDSLLNITNDITPELILSYKYLIEDTKKNKNLEKQLKYVNSLIKYDSIIDSNYKYLNNKIIKEYETPRLIEEKEKLISSLNKSKKKANIWIYTLFIFLIFISALYLYNLKKKSIYLRKYENLLENINKKQVEAKESPISSEDKLLDIPEKTVENILDKLHKFEKSNVFINKQYTLSELAKEFSTNSSYLSKVINVHKKSNFSNYLNNIKVDYAINLLKSDIKLRSYTIKAIAIECGFNNAQPFTKAFYKKTGIYPSYFIKKLNN